MHVLGDLIRMPEQRRDLPLPWWHRAPLGFLDRTSVYVALLETRDRAAGELIVSAVDPHVWSRLLKVTCSEGDKPGVLARVFGAAKPLNIALAETATIETPQSHSGSHHLATLICEPLDAAEDIIQIKAALDDRLRKCGITQFESTQLLIDSNRIIWSDVARIEHGWIKDCRWGERIGDHYPEAENRGIELSRAVVSADTEQRILRFVFPRKGARTIHLEHRDRPGALEALTESLAECKLNILSALLRRGGAMPQKAVLVAVCEPSKELDTESVARIDAIIKARLKQLPPWLSAVHQVHEGRDPLDVIYPTRTDQVIARVPEHLIPSVQADKKSLPAKMLPVFISRRFVEHGDRAKKVVERMHKVLRDHGCHPVEALPTPGSMSPSPTQVASKMWVSKAGVVLVMNSPDTGKGDKSVQGAFSCNLAHEFGFLQGQGKPILALIEEGAEHAFQSIANLAGLSYSKFAQGPLAFNPDEDQSIDSAMIKWIASLEGLK